MKMSMLGNNREEIEAFKSGERKNKTIIPSEKGIAEQRRQYAEMLLEECSNPKVKDLVRLCSGMPEERLRSLINHMESHLA